MQVKKLEEIEAEVDGTAKCPFDHHHNNTFVMTEDGSYYSATFTDFVARDPAIFRQMGPNPVLRTYRRDSRWLNSMYPKVVSVKSKLTKKFKQK
jgi:hypothetical protein